MSKQAFTKKLERTWSAQRYDGTWVVTNGYARCLRNENLSENEAELIALKLNRLEMLTLQAWTE